MSFIVGRRVLFVVGCYRPDLLVAVAEEAPDRLRFPECALVETNFLEAAAVDAVFREHVLQAVRFVIVVVPVSDAVDISGEESDGFAVLPVDA